MKYKVQIHVADKDGNAEKVLSSGIKRVREKVARAIFGPFTEAIVLSREKTCSGITITETVEEGADGRS